MLISARRLVMLYISTSFCEIISYGIKVIKQTQFSLLKITKGNNSAKNVGVVTVVKLCTSSGHAFVCAKFREIILNGIKVIERTQFLY